MPEVVLVVTRKSDGSYQLDTTDTRGYAWPGASVRIKNTTTSSSIAVACDAFSHPTSVNVPAGAPGKPGVATAAIKTDASTPADSTVTVKVGDQVVCSGSLKARKAMVLQQDTSGPQFSPNELFVKSGEEIVFPSDHPNQRKVESDGLSNGGGPVGSKDVAMMKAKIVTSPTRYSISHRAVVSDGRGDDDLHGGRGQAGTLNISK